jgi:hypothetical protein
LLVVFDLPSFLGLGLKFNKKILILEPVRAYMIWSQVFVTKRVEENNKIAVLKANVILGI